jgi:hypothetical protein
MSRRPRPHEDPKCPCKVCEAFDKPRRAPRVYEASEIRLFISGVELTGFADGGTITIPRPD